MSLLAIYRTQWDSSVFAVQVSLSSANEAPSKFPAYFHVLIMDLNVDQFWIVIIIINRDEPFGYIVNFVVKNSLLIETCRIYFSLVNNTIERVPDIIVENIISALIIFIISLIYYITILNSLIYILGNFHGDFLDLLLKYILGDNLNMD
jgi:hypothetical protein